MNKILWFCLLLAAINTNARTLTQYQDDDGSMIFSGKKIEGLEKVSEKKYDTKLKDWNLVCDKDRFNGSKSCMLSKDTVLIMLRDGKYAVSVGKRHVPRSQSAIKIDNNATIYGKEGISESPEKVIKQLNHGSKVFTRYQEWPYKHNRDDEVDLTGFPEKFEEMLELYKQL
ncbi:hypothetical protein [Acinetobacter haemolyticus]|uniref:hypothetical protein n=1 Tax=Acinetobacter haemolyticus TaxID=29430 RepID=UPI0021CD9422|nr:hypothetical protein [Acinetobacter haemolyticus]MCU4378846.1 hypothetical protein [Acinetobacter haemolyticus]